MNFDQESIDVLLEILDIKLENEVVTNKPYFIHQAILRGFPYTAFISIQKKLDISQKNLASILGISPRTVNRRKANNQFSKIESDRLYRTAQIIVLSMNVFGNMDKVRLWLKNPNHVLDGETPIFLSNTLIGFNQIQDELLRIEYGIYV